MAAYYNENDPYCAAWLRNLIAAGHLPDGDVDDRSIADVQPDDLADYRQCHFFAGIGGWPSALRLAGWPDDEPVWTGSCPCFPSGTLVVTSRGLTPIEAVAIGDQVLTHRGRFRRVTATGSEFAECIELRGQGHHGLVCTPSHPFYVGREEWRPAHEMKGHRWATVIAVPAVAPPPYQEQPRGYFWDKTVRAYRVKGEVGGETVYIGVAKTVTEAKQLRAEAVFSGRIAVRGANAVDVTSEGFAYFLGYWLGDGWVTGDSVVACGGPDDAALLNELWGRAGLSGKAYQERTGARIVCGSKPLAKWLKESFGIGAASKTIPLWLYGMPESYRRSFIDGYRRADGHRERGGWGASTVSKAIAVGLRMLINQLGLSASIRYIDAPPTKVIEGRLVKQRPWYRVTAYETARSFRFADGHGWGLVRSIRPAGKHLVFNLAVEDDESYTADGIVVHNCQPFSCAGQRKGHDDERHLWPAFYRLIAECRPATVFGEQVAGALGREWLAGVRADLEGAGYAVGAADLTAAGVGAPHIRQRLFWVADTGCTPRRAEHGHEPRLEVGRGEAPANAAGPWERGGTDRLAEPAEPRRARRLVKPDWRQALEPDGRCVFGGLGDADQDGRGAPRRGVSHPEERHPQPHGRLDDALSDGRGAGGHDHAGDVRQQPAANGSRLGDPGAPRLPAPEREDLCGARRRREGRAVAEPSAACSRGMGDTPDSGRGKERQIGGGGCARSRAQGASERSGVGFWAGAEWLPCLDGKARRAQPGIFPLADGLPGRVGKLRASGNAIVPQAAAEFISAFMERGGHRE